jgi:hypothetical protein
MILELANKKIYLKDYKPHKVENAYHIELQKNVIADENGRYNKIPLENWHNAEEAIVIGMIDKIEENGVILENVDKSYIGNLDENEYQKILNAILEIIGKKKEETLPKEQGAN